MKTQRPTALLDTRHLDTRHLDTRHLDTRHIELAALIQRFTDGDGIHSTAIPGLFLYCFSQPPAPIHGGLGPAFAMVVQGSKQVSLGGEVYFYDPTHYLVLSVELPLIGKVLEASPAAPYLSFRLDFDRMQLNSMIAESNRNAQENLGEKCGLFVSDADGVLIDASLRLIRLLETPEDIEALAPLVSREIIYRILMSEQGSRLRNIVRTDTRSHRIACTIDWLKRNYTRSLSIEEMANEARMSPTAFFRYFKAITAITPLQFQKQLRLQEAHRLMCTERISVAMTAHRVGYESLSQFSREYSRHFGITPSEHRSFHFQNQKAGCNRQPTTVFPD